MCVRSRFCDNSSKCPFYNHLANEKRASCFNINHIHAFYINMPRHKKTLGRGGGGEREGCEQYRRSLISAFVICLLENTISRLDKRKI